MTSSRTKLLLQTLAAMSLFNEFNMSTRHNPLTIEDEPQRPVIRYIKKQKCFRKDCDNMRTSNKLYCSAECCKLDKYEKSVKTR